MRTRSHLKALVRGLALFSVLCSAQLCAQQYVFRSFQQNEGLGNLAVGPIVVDNNGFLWAGTENGVYRYSEESFERLGQEHGLATVAIVDLYADAWGRIWVVTQDNLYFWEGERFLPVANRPILPSTKFHLASEDHDHLLVIDGHRLLRITLDQRGAAQSVVPAFSAALEAAHPELLQLSSVAFFAGSPASLWVGSEHGSRMFSFPARQFPIASDIPLQVWDAGKGLAKDWWRQAYRDHAGTIWMAGLHHVAALAPGATSFVDRHIVDDNPAEMEGHVPMVEDAAGNLLVPVHRGLAVWEHEHWQIIGRENGLTIPSAIMGLATESTGAIWIASRGDGILRWPGHGQWEAWTVHQGLPSPSVWSMHAFATGRILVGTEGGLVGIDPHTNRAQSFGYAAVWPYGIPNVIESSGDGSLLVATLPGKVLRIDSYTGKAEFLGVLPGFIRKGIRDSDGNLYLATEQGIYQRPANASSSSMPQPVAEVRQLLGDFHMVEGGCSTRDGATWFLGNDRILRVSHQRWSRASVTGLPRFMTRLMALSCASDGDLWVAGPQTGTWRLQRDGAGFRAIQIPLPDALHDVTPLAILVDRRGWLWLGTDQGLVVWNGKSWRHLTTLDGLIWEDINQGVLQEAEDGSIWIGTSGGIAHLLHPEDLFHPTTMQISIVAFLQGNSPMSLRGDARLPWSGDPLEFSMATSATAAQKNLIYRVRLDGAQTDWSEQSDRVLSYAHLSPGAYMLEAQVCSMDRQNCSSPAQLSFFILPPWWRRSWFILLCAGIVAGLFVWADRLRQMRIRRQNVQLEALVRERTAELRASQVELEHRATHDALTGLLNRPAILHLLQREMERAQREDRILYAVLVDVDHFKEVNDLHGHLVGDQALSQLAQRMQSAVRSYDGLGRYGGEEFLVVISQSAKEIEADRVRNFHAAVTGMKLQANSGVLQVNCSMGATLYSPHLGLRTAEEILAASDQALYAAKNAGRNRILFGCLYTSQCTPHCSDISSTQRPSSGPSVP
ncbi:diguanylate cyclase [Telmatobacter bradus]|uniref:ligand-binding sensor domain-containing diguanylate cyclase n=1 Tax=Telmatobacter bradus TaxID=474953 RepID=UPI003B4371A4